MGLPVIACPRGPGTELPRGLVLRADRRGNRAALATSCPRCLRPCADFRTPHFALVTPVVRSCRARRQVPWALTEPHASYRDRDRGEHGCHQRLSLCTSTTITGTRCARSSSIP